MVKRLAILAALIVCALLGTWGTAHAETGKIPRTTDELLTAYGIGDQPSDFVVVVDTSGSMMDPPAIYPDVLRVYAEFVDAIGAQDHLAVITFDASAVVRFSGEVNTPERRSAAKAALPPTANGGRTDIGAALDAALDRMERADAAQVQTLIFLTDGKIVASGSPYGTPGSPAWQELRARADRLAGSRTVSAFGAGLGGGATDVAVVKDVFPRAKIVSLPTDQLPGFFREAVERARVERLRSPVEQELNRYGVTAAVDHGKLADVTRLEVRLTSTLPILGATVNVRGVRVMTADGTPLEATLPSGPQPVTIAPGETSPAIPVDVVVPGLDHSLKIGETRETRHFRVILETESEVEPADILARDLAIDTQPRVTQAPLAEASRGHGVAYWMLGVWAGIAAAILWFLGWIYRRFIATPRLRGQLEVINTDPVEVLNENREKVVIGPYDLRGCRDSIPNSKFNIAAAGASIEFTTRRGKFRGFPGTRNPRMWASAAGSTGVVLFSPSGGITQSMSETTLARPGDEFTLGPTKIRVVLGGSGRKGSARK